MALPTLQQQADALRAGRITSRELVEQALTRIGDPVGEGARAFTRVYAERARAQAQASDWTLSAGLGRSVLEGLPVSIKDLFDVAGETTMAGSVVLKDATPAKAHALVVQRLIAAGAVIVGRTNMTEFAYSGLGLNPHYGTPRNPWDRATGRIPGGSTSGGAVSVTDGMALAALGSDTGGSVRIPSALCGLTGFKPSAWRVPMDGVLPLSAQLDSIGPLAASVACCAALDAILSGEPDVLPAPASLRHLRLAAPLTLVREGMDATVAAAFDATLRQLSAAGAQVEDLAIPEFTQLATINAKGGFTAAEAWAWHRPHIARAPERYDPRVISRIRRGEALSAADWLDLMAARKAWVAAVEQRIAGYDALLLPTTPVVAPPIAALEASDELYGATNLLMLRNPTLINFLDGCALSLPCHPTGGAPVGLMIAGANGTDQRILSIGLAVEACLHKVRA